jgi:biopolymer transport protein ExbD
MKHRNRKDRATGLAFNATPLVDVIFILTIFFMLVSRFSSAELVPMELPNPHKSQAKATRARDRMVINCRPADAANPSNGLVAYSLGPNLPEPLQTIAARLSNLKRQSPDLRVLIRADRRLPYSAVRSVMQIFAENQIEMLNVVAHVAEN